MITDRDQKFLKNLEKQAAKSSLEQTEAPAEGEPPVKEDEDDELAVIIREEEEENRKKEIWKKEKEAKDAEDAEKKRIKDQQDLVKAELIK